MSTAAGDRHEQMRKLAINTIADGLEQEYRARGETPPSRATLWRVAKERHKKLLSPLSD